MEENENEVVNSSETSAPATKSKKYITLGIGVVIAIILIVVLLNIFRNSPEKTVKQFAKNMNNKKASKIVDQIDFVGLAAWSSCYGDYEDFNDNYDEYKEDLEDDEDEYDEMVEDMKDQLEENFEDIEKIKVEVKKIKKAKKVKDAKNLFKVNATIKTEVKREDDSKTTRDTTKIDFYLYKKGGKYYIVGMDTKSGDGLDLF